MPESANPVGEMLKEAEPGGEGWAGGGCLLTGGVCRDEGKFYMNMWRVWDWARFRHVKQRGRLAWCFP